MSRKAMVNTTIISIVVILLVVLGVFLTNNHEMEIREKVDEQYGEVLSIENKVFDLGPFKLKTKEQYIYQFTYEKDGELKEGWVRFGLFDDWYMDGKWLK